MSITRNKYNRSLEVIKLRVIECAQNILEDFLEWCIDTILSPTDGEELWNHWLNVLKKHRPDITEPRRQEHWLERLYIISCQFTTAEAEIMLHETFSSNKKCKTYEYCDMEMWHNCYVGDCT